MNPGVPVPIEVVVWFKQNPLGAAKEALLNKKRS
jgi:hypothetical protein